jgi:hypothetical protein
MNTKFQRQPLRIPSGWTVRQHELLDLDPETLALEDKSWELFREDLLQLYHETWKLVLDVGWNPEAEPTGTFNLTLVKNGDWEKPEAHWSGRSLAALVERIEAIALRPPRS